jgi:hypothetical protein
MIEPVRTSELLLRLPLGDAAQDPAFDALAVGAGLIPWPGRSFQLAGTVPGVTGEFTLLDQFSGRVRSRRALPLLAGTADRMAATLDARQEVFNLLHVEGDCVQLRTDPMGFKPLYLLQTEQALYLSSRLRTLLGFSTARDVFGLHGLLILRGCIGTRTLFRDITILPSGATAQWQSGRWEGS